MKRILLPSIALALLVAGCELHSAPRPNVEADEAPKAVFFGNPESSISSAVLLPAEGGALWTSGTVPPVLDDAQAAGTRARYGDTETQALGILERLQAQLAEQDMTMQDIVYLRVYLVADPHQENQIDFRGWFNAYAQFFDTDENPTKPARSTVGVASLVNPDWLIEIEAFALPPA